MTEIIDQTKPSEADGPATEKTGGQGLPPWRMFAIVAVASASGGLAGILAVKGLLAAKGLTAAHLAWGLEGVAKANAASATLLPSSQAALGTLAPSAATSPLPGTAVGAAGWADKLAAFCGKLAQNPLIAGVAAGTVGGAGTGLGVAVGKLSGVRQQLQEHLGRIEALGHETAQIKATLVETDGTVGRKTGHSSADAERLEDIVGIGEVYAERLRVAGVTSFAGLSTLSAERVKEIVGRGLPLSIESIRSWIKQADALAKGRHPEADDLNHK